MYNCINTKSSDTPSIDEPGKGETQKSILAMSEEEITALEERARKIGVTGGSPFVYRSPFAPSSSSFVVPHTSSSLQPTSFVPHNPHITCLRYFGVDHEHVEEIVDERKTSQNAFDAARTKVFH